MRNKIRQILEISIVKELALLFAGVLAGVFIGILLTREPVLETKTGILGALVFFLILLGSGAIPKMWHRYNIWLRRSALKVGILNDMGWDLKNKEIYTRTDISPGAWKKEIEELARDKGIEIKVDLISLENYFDMYNAIINPYGGVYPEYDLKNFKTMNKILSYIYEGGLFVNVADIPCYWACNPSIKPWRRIDTARKGAPYAYIHEYSGDPLKLGRIIPFAQFPLFKLTPFTSELGVDVYNIEKIIPKWDILEFEDIFLKIKVGDLKVNVHRAAGVRDYLDPIIKPQPKVLPSLFEMRMEGIPMTPLFFVTYGKGKLLSSLIFENSENHSKKTRNALKRMLTMLIMDFIDS